MENEKFRGGCGVDSWRGALPLGGNDRNETVAKPPRRRFRRRATPAKRGIGPGCWPTEVGGPAGRLRAAWRAHRVLVANIVLFRVQGCEEGLEIRTGGI